jgi:hypothetical protein
MRISAQHIYKRASEREKEGERKRGQNIYISLHIIEYSSFRLIEEASHQKSYNINE